MFGRKKFKIEYGVIGLISSVLVYLLSLLGAFSPIVDGLRSVSSGLQEGLFRFGQEFNTLTASFSKIGEITQTSDNLLFENIDLQSQVASLRAEVDLLEKLLLQQQKLPGKNQVPGNVRYMSDNMSEIIAGVGSNQGVGIGDVAVIGNVPIGTVIEISANYCKVKSLKSSSIRIPVQLVESKYIGFLEYQTDKGFVINNLPTDYTFINNEQVLTTGVNSDYFGGLLIGSADQLIGTETDPSKTLKLEYPVDLSKIQVLFIVLNSYVEIQTTY